ncbi:uncharacterized protein [Nicotiana sylvestris]|uniref:uncharacterized protein n=1 Tax=Nicotiana sylvestris TaxID=4096 RepID=UPI00388CE4FD
MPKFDLYDGHGDPIAHLRGFCSKMRGARGKDELLMAYFSQSLSGSALEWYTRQDHRRWYTWDDLAQAFYCHFQYNLEVIPDRLSLTKLEKKHNESFREYGFRWREQAARVDPPIKESKSFNEVVKIGGMVEEGLKSNKIMNYSAIKVTTQAIPGCAGGIIGKKKREDVVTIDSETWEEVKEEVCETQGLTRSGRFFAPEELRKAKDNPVLVKKAVTEEEAEEFLRKIKMQDYSIVEQLKNTPAQISILALLIHSNEHRQALMKILNEAHVPDKISVNHLEKIANKIFEVNRVTFSDEELPVEGTEHNRALYLMVKCEDSVVTWVLVDNGSSVNICPLSTLSKLKVEDERIHKNSICVRGFDDEGKDLVGDIVLEVTIGPVEFTMEFQVLDIVVSYNLLLGRPWFHAAKAVPSTLHHMVKFEWDR